MEPFEGARFDGGLVDRDLFDSGPVREESLTASFFAADLDLEDKDDHSRWGHGKRKRHQSNRGSGTRQRRLYRISCRCSRSVSWTPCICR